MARWMFLHHFQSVFAILHEAHRSTGQWFYVLVNDLITIIRPVPKHRMISISIFEISLKIDISIHNRTSKKICSIRYDVNLYLLSWKSRKHLYKRRKNCRRSPPPSAADFLCCFEVLNTDVPWTSINKAHR